MARKTYVLDTNVLLYDPEAMHKFKDNNVVMPLIVLEELDKMKRFTNELGKNARTIIRFINELKGDLFKGISIKNGVKFSVFINHNINQKESHFPLPLCNIKHQVLFSAYTLHHIVHGVVIFVSKDFVLRIKAESIGIKAQDYENLKKSFDTLYKGHRIIELPKQQIDQFITKGFLKMEEDNFLPNEYCHFFCNEGSHSLGKYNAAKKGVDLLNVLGNKIWGIKPLNDEQRFAMDLLMRDEIKLVSMIGQAGTGKTLLALTCGLRKVFDEAIYKRILISRPIMPLGKDIGYLPGTKEEKMFHWMQPIYDNLEYVCETISGSESGMETKQWIMESEKIEMESVSYIRGRSVGDTYIIIDEAQNLTPHEIKTIISRAGKGSKVIVMGDPTQIDNPYLDKDSNALTYIVSRFKYYEIYGHIFFEKTERSELSAITAEIL